VLSLPKTAVNSPSLTLRKEAVKVDYDFRLRKMNKNEYVLGMINDLKYKTIIKKAVNSHS